MMRVSTATCVSIHVTSALARVKELVERTSAEELSEDLFWIAENERETTKDEVILERVVLMSSTVMISVVVIIVS